MGKTKIDWADEVFNPVWGCRNNCIFCYARKMSKRFGAKFGVKDFKPTWIESNFIKPLPKKPSRIFVNSMSDIVFWKQEWMGRVIAKIKEYPQHIFMFLTKAPKVYGKYDFPSNCWLGVTVTNNEDMKRGDILLTMLLKNTTFISIEPILCDDLDCNYIFHNWVIIGLETGNKKGFIPRLKTIELIVENCISRGGVPLFMKESMKKVWRGKLIQEFPR